MKKVAALLCMLMLVGCSSAPGGPVNQNSVPPAGTSVFAAGLTVEEHPIAKGENLPMGLELVKSLEPVRAKRKSWREPTPETVAAKANQVLAPLGYRVAANTTGTMDLFKGDQAKATGIANVQAIYPSADGKDFLLQGAGNGAPLWLTASGPLPPDLYEKVSTTLRAPVYAGNDLVYVRVTELWDVEVVRKDKVVYTYTHPQALRIASPSFLTQGLTVWDGKWVLETGEGTVIVDGENLNKKLGYDEIFGFHMQAGKPMFFFKQDGQIGISYGGQILPQQYDRVPHYGCCDTTQLNPKANDAMTTFFGSRDGQWYYVEMGVYQ